jgi:hypothetical protein
MSNYTYNLGMTVGGMVKQSVPLSAEKYKRLEKALFPIVGAVLGGTGGAIYGKKKDKLRTTLAGALLGTAGGSFLHKLSQEP